METPDQTASHLYRDALRADVQTLYVTGCCCEDTEIPAVTALAAQAAADEAPAERFDDIRWIIAHRLGGGPRSEAAAALIGVDDTRSPTLGTRQERAAALLGYKNWDSFRHGQERRRNVIDVILDEITGGLVELAVKRNFSYETQSEALPTVLPRNSSAAIYTGADVVVRRKGLVDIYLDGLFVDDPEPIHINLSELD
jgi:hypothetical protein